MDDLDLTKRDMAVTYGGRSFAVRAYRDKGVWYSVIIENRTPMTHWLEPTPDAAMCFGATVAYIAAAVDAKVGAGKSRV